MFLFMQEILSKKQDLSSEWAVGEAEAISVTIAMPAAWVKTRRWSKWPRRHTRSWNGSPNRCNKPVGAHPIAGVEKEDSMDKVIIKDLVARGIIGLNEWERETPQEILINLALYTDLRKAGEMDDIGDSVDYHTVAEKAQAHAESAGRLTVEALADDLARLCLEEPGVQKVQVRVEKPGAVRFVRSVGVEIERSKEDYPPR
jgi:FolB domain-containing protein